MNNVNKCGKIMVLICQYISIMLKYMSVTTIFINRWFFSLPMVKIYDVNPTQLINGVAEELKNVDGVNPPEWAKFVKTGVHKERPPENPEWWYIRSAAVLRKVFKLGPIGVSKLRKAYGGRKNRGHKPDKTMVGSGNIIRTILQQLEGAQLVKQAQKGVHKGRVATPQGIALMDKVARQLISSSAISSKTKPNQATEKQNKEAEASN